MSGDEKDCRKEIERLERVVVSSLNALYESLSLIEKRLERIERLMKTTRTQQSLHMSKESLRDKKGGIGVRDALEEIERRGFAFASSIYLSKGIKPRKLLAMARTRGYKIVDLGGDYLIISLSAVAELESRLSSVKTVDQNIASKAAGDLSELFEALRSRGRAYYDARKRRWIVDLT